MVNVLKVRIVRGSGVSDSIILEEILIRLLNLMYERSHVTTIINNKFRSMNLTTMQDAVPVLLDNPTFLIKHNRRFIIRYVSHSVVLGRENVARAPMEVTAEVLKSLNHHFRMGGHVYRYINTGATRHLKSL